jgi:hypothetical protein
MRSVFVLHSFRWLSLGVVAILLVGCPSPEPLFPVEPQIEFVRLDPAVTYEISAGVPGTPPALVLRFTDGDGDLGSADANIYNFYLQDLRDDRLPLRDSTQVGWDTLPGGQVVPLFEYDTLYTGLIEGSMPDLTPDARNPSIQGEIRYVFSAGLNRLPNPNNPSQPLPAQDTVRFRVWVVDRAGNVSNTIVTEPFTVLPVQ